MHLANPIERTMATQDDGAMAFDETVPRRTVRLWTAGLVVLCIGALLLLFRHIGATVPYPQHTDEGFVSGPAANILVTGQLHPQRFNYPSFPTYLAATAMSLGFLRGAANLEIRDVNAIGRVGYPHYETPRVMKTARQAFALLAVVCLAMTGLSAWLTFRRPSTMVVAPLLLLTCPLFFKHAWLYLNVDIVAASFVMLTLAACLLGIARLSTRQSAIVPGIFAGLATAGKYTLAIAILPVLLAIGFYVARSRMIWTWAVALAAMVIAFLVAVPYSLVDIPGFLNGVGYEVFHYASGHAGFAGEPGWEQLLYYLRHFLTEFGYGASALALVGIVAITHANWQRAAVVLIFPLALLWILTGQRVHFTRNALAIQPFIAMFAAFGLVTLHGWLVGLARRRGWTSPRVSVPVLAGLILTMATVPFWRFGELLRDRTDSRNVARTWVAKNVPYDWGIVVPTELGFDRRALNVRSRRLKFVDLASARDPEALDALLADVAAPAAILVPRWGADRRSPGRKTADALNQLTGQWRVLQAFGTNDVLVNYTFATAWGDPAFTIAVLK
jgi:hypothetical protein